MNLSKCFGFYSKTVHELKCLEASLDGNLRIVCQIQLVISLTYFPFLY